MTGTPQGAAHRRWGFGARGAATASVPAAEPRRPGFSAELLLSSLALALALAAAAVALIR